MRGNDGNRDGSGSLIQELRDELRAVGERVARLEGERAAAAGAAAPHSLPHGRRSDIAVAGVDQSRDRKGAVAEPEEITEEELTAISAAVAAYLGVRAHIRQIRLVSSRAWAQEGRVSIQASHQLH